MARRKSPYGRLIYDAVFGFKSTEIGIQRWNVLLSSEKPHAVITFFGEVQLVC
jgi:hypothetical protein